MATYFHIRVSDALKERTRKAAEQSGVTEAEFVREAVEEAIRRLELAGVWLVYRAREDKRAPWLLISASSREQALLEAEKEFGSAGFQLDAVRASDAPTADLAIVPK